MRLKREQAACALEALHFARKPEGRTQAEQVIQAVRWVNSIQFDPLNVVGLNPDLVLQSRIEEYDPASLRSALYERFALLDGIDKNLCIYPAEDFPCFARTRRRGAGGYGENEMIRAVMDQVLQAIDRRGPLCSDDLPWKEKVRWPWGSAPVGRAALETLWAEGRLVVHHKKGVRRYFDLIERHVPGKILNAPEPHEKQEDYEDWQIMRRIRAVGFLWNRGSDAWLGTNLKKSARDAAFERLVKQGRIEPVEIEGEKSKLYLLAEDVLELGRRPDGRARVLAPLDNMLWDRRLIEALFGFRYRWEVYVPAEKREYGYYVLPILCGGRFIARFEPVQGGGIKNWWWEEDVTAREKQAAEECMDRFDGYLRRLNGFNQAAFSEQT